MKVDYIALSIPIFFLFIGIELAWSIRRNLRYYRLNDSIANLSQGIGSQLVGLLLKTVTFFGYLYIFDHWRLYTFPATIWTWLLLFMGVDFFYYWFHRMSHEINALWASHIVHHQSEEYNLTVALRQSWFQGGFSWTFYLPLAVLGFDPVMFLTVSSLNTLYQFWIHTRAIGTIGPLEWILNTPSHHRVHHGSNPKYIDKNHGGTLIIWDRLFGTFQKEEEEVVYGITTPLSSWNPVWANLHYWNDLYRSSARSRKAADKVKVFLKPPGWFPAEQGGFRAPTEIDLNQYQKYDPLYSATYLRYVLFQFLICIIGTTLILFMQGRINLLQTIGSSALIVLTLISCGAMFEEKKWFRAFEYSRIFLLLFSPLLYLGHLQMNWIGGATLALALFSLAWFGRLNPQSSSHDQTS